MEIKLSTIDDALFLSKYYLENASHLQPWEPLIKEGYHAVEAWRERLLRREAEQKERSAAYFLAYEQNPREIIASCSLTSITRGAFLGCYMGYSVAKLYEGRGVMKKLCTHAIQYAFNDLGLNRVMANYMPRNTRSEKLLESLGFETEGLARRYLCINGKWEDHVLASLLNPNYK